MRWYTSIGDLWNDVWPLVFNSIVLPIMIMGMIFIFGYMVGGLKSDMHCFDMMKEGAGSYKPVRPETYKLQSYHPPYPYYRYDIQTYDKIDITLGAALELDERLRMCGLDEMCNMVYPISEDTWAQLQVELAKQGHYAAREIVTGY